MLINKNNLQYFFTVSFLNKSMGNEIPAVIESNIKNMVNPLEKIESISSILLDMSFSMNIKFIMDKTVL